MPADPAYSKLALVQATPSALGEIALDISGHLQVHNGASVDVYSIIPVGTLTIFAGGSIPNGYLVCDGGSVLQSVYPALFAVIGTSYGSVDGTHFNLPDLRTRVPVGFASGDATFGTLAQSGGAKTVAGAAHTHTTPAHTHPLSSAGQANLAWSTAGQLWTSRVSAAGWTDNVKTVSTTAVPLTTDAVAQTTGIPLNGNTDASTAGASGSTAAGASSVVQPFVTMYYIIKI